MASAIIQRTIRSGAPAYNKGDIDGCVAVYGKAAQLLLVDCSAELTTNVSQELMEALQIYATKAPKERASLECFEMECLSREALAWKFRNAFDLQLSSRCDLNKDFSEVLCSLPPQAKPCSKLARAVDGSKEETEETYRSCLPPVSFQILRQKATEPRHSTRRANGGFDDVFDAGVYACLACRTPLYTSNMKYDCGCGWPGFWTNMDGAVRAVRDDDGSRDEIVCNACNSHLGHVFFGESHGHPTDERHCVNSCSLSFLPQGSALWQDCTYAGKVTPTRGADTCVIA